MKRLSFEFRLKYSMELPDVGQSRSKFGSRTPGLGRGVDDVTDGLLLTLLSNKLGTTGSVYLTDKKVTDRGRYETRTQFPKELQWRQVETLKY